MRGGMPYELMIGRRYLRSSGNRFLSFISLISMLGVAIGVAVLIQRRRGEKPDSWS